MISRPPLHATARRLRRLSRQLINHYGHAASKVTDPLEEAADRLDQAATQLAAMEIIEASANADRLW